MNGAAPVAGIAHVNLRGSEALIERLRAFYVDVIGLREGPRPAMRSGQRGHWLYAGEHDVVHLSVDPQCGDPVGPDARRAGFNHVAFACHGVADAMRRLRETGVEFRASRVDDPPQAQLFLFDPAGTRVELNFAGESPPT